MIDTKFMAEGIISITSKGEVTMDHKELANMLINTDCRNELFGFSQPILRTVPTEMPNPTTLTTTITTTVSSHMPLLKTYTTPRFIIITTVPSDMPYLTIVLNAKMIHALSPSWPGSLATICVVSMQMYKEIQLTNPLVPNMKLIFIGVCKQMNDGCWVVVDASFDPPKDAYYPSKFRRLLSGCLIESIDNGLSKVEQRKF
ncbi:homeobox-leucine zipper protein HDG11-like protein [Tanacetum coccineum]